MPDLCVLLPLTYSIRPITHNDAKKAANEELGELLLPLKTEKRNGEKKKSSAKFLISIQLKEEPHTHTHTVQAALISH